MSWIQFPAHFVSLPMERSWNWMVLGFLTAQTIPGFYEFRKYIGNRVGILLSMAFPHSSGVNHLPGGAADGENVDGKV